jgi:hypothetical protein
MARTMPGRSQTVREQDCSSIRRRAVKHRALAFWIEKQFELQPTVISAGLLLDHSATFWHQAN